MQVAKWGNSLAVRLPSAVVEALDLKEGDPDTGKAILRDYINATIGFEELSRVTKRPAKSLMRMFGPAGNPQARNLFEVIGHLQRAEISSSNSPSKPRAKRRVRAESDWRAGRRRRRQCLYHEFRETAVC